MAEPQQSGPIAVYGATGYTGRLVAAELRRRGADFLISGRNPEKLDALSTKLGGVPFKAVSLADADSLRSLLEPCAAVIACAGPFTLHGEPVVSAAADSGTHYIDTTGEQTFIKLVFDRYGERAAANGAAVVPAMGFDYVPGNMIAALAAEGMGPLEEIVIAYGVRGFGATRGTALSGLGIFSGGSSLEWRDGGLRQASRKIDGGKFRFSEPLGESRTLRYPAGEQITVPRHVETANVTTLLSGMSLPPPPFASIAVPALGLSMRTPLRHLAEAAIKRMPEGPSESARRKASFVVGCEARTGSQTRRGSVTGTDVYGLTAVTTVEAALRTSEGSYDRTGALAPAQAFDPADFLDSLSGFGVSYEVEQLPEPATAIR